MRLKIAFYPLNKMKRMKNSWPYFWNLELLLSKHCSKVSDFYRFGWSWWARFTEKCFYDWKQSVFWFFWKGSPLTIFTLHIIRRKSHVPLVYRLLLAPLCTSKSLKLHPMFLTWSRSKEIFYWSEKDAMSCLGIMKGPNMLLGRAVVHIHQLESVYCYFSMHSRSEW